MIDRCQLSRKYEFSLFIINTEWKTWESDDILLRHCKAVYNQNTIDRWTQGMHPPFP